MIFRIWLVHVHEWGRSFSKHWGVWRVRRLRSFCLECFEFYANLAKLKRWLRRFRLIECFEFYARRKLLHSSQLKWVWNSWLPSFCLKHSEAYASIAKLSTPINNKKFYSVQSEALWVYVIYAELSALNFTCVTFVVATPSTQTLRGLRELFGALNSD